MIINVNGIEFDSNDIISEITTYMNNKTEETKPQKHTLVAGDMLVTMCEDCDEVLFTKVIERIGNIAYVTDMVHNIEDIDENTLNVITIQYLNNNNFRLYK